VRSELKDPEIAHRRRWLTLTVLCISLMVIGLDNTILNVALPTLAHAKTSGGLGASGSALQWIVDSYTLVFAGLLLTMGSLGDRFGRYKFLTFGLAVFGTGSVLSAFAPSAGFLIATRSVMGIGGACIMPGTLSILSNVFRTPVERAKAIGVWAGVSALGVGIGPVAGGALLTHFWWGSVFLVNVPIVITALALGYFFVPDSSDKTTPRLDPVGAGLSIVSLGALLWAIIEAPSHGWTSPEILAGFAVGSVLLLGFFMWELKSSSPMLDLHFFQNPRFSAASAAIMLVFLALFGTIFLLTQYLQSVLGYSTLKAGAILIPQSAALMIFAFLSPRWVVRFGNKIVVAVGLTLVAVSLVGFLSLDVGSSAFHVIVVSVIMGVGMGNVMSPATESIMGSLPREKAGVGSAMNDTTRQVGGAVGVAVLGSILSSHYGPNLASRLSGKVPVPLITAARDSVGRAVDVVGTPGGARYRTQIISAAHESFVGGLHLASIVAAFIVMIAVAGVVIWLPARAIDQDEGTLPAAGAGGTASPPAPVGSPNGSGRDDLAVVLDHSD
jgi:EmrB/QacA subfamily drug resistance transporter